MPVCCHAVDQGDRLLEAGRPTKALVTRWPTPWCVVLFAAIGSHRNVRSAGHAFGWGAQLQHRYSSRVGLRDGSSRFDVGVVQFGTSFGNLGQG